MIVIVESIPVIRARLFRLLRQGPLPVLAYPTPEELIKGLATLPEAITLILCDSDFPQLSGLEFLRHVRAATYSALDPNVLFLLMHGGGSNVDLEEAHALGAISVEKPDIGREIGSITAIDRELLQTLSGFAAAVRGPGVTIH